MNKDKIDKLAYEASRKTGVLSAKEQVYIQSHCQTETAAAIGSVLNRSEKVITKYITEKMGQVPFGSDMGPDEELRLTLQAAFKHTPEWMALKREFTPEEIQYFEHRYAKLLSQFQDDMTPTEETQIFGLIKFEILMQRVLGNRQKSEMDVKRMRKAIAKLYEGCGDDLTKLSSEQRGFLDNMENNISNILSFQHASNKEYSDLQAQHSAIMKALKATRDQRIDKVQNNKVTFVEVIKSIMDETVREREGRQMELMRLASAKELGRLSVPHTYADKKVDLPILNADTIG